MSRKALLVFAAVALALLVLAQFVPSSPAPQATTPPAATDGAQREVPDPAKVVWDQPVAARPDPGPIASTVQDDAVLRELRRQKLDREIEAGRQATELRNLRDDVDRLQRANR